MSSCIPLRSPTSLGDWIRINYSPLGQFTWSKQQTSVLFNDEPWRRTTKCCVKSSLSISSSSTAVQFSRVQHTAYDVRSKALPFITLKINISQEHSDKLWRSPVLHPGHRFWPWVLAPSLKDKSDKTGLQMISKCHHLSAKLSLFQGLYNSWNDHITTFSTALDHS